MSESDIIVDVEGNKGVGGVEVVRDCRKPQSQPLKEAGDTA